MSVEDTEELDSQNQPTEEVENTEVVEDAPAEEATEDTSEDIESLKQKNQDLYDRARKAEAQMRKLRDEQKQRKEPQSLPSDQGSLTIKSVREFKAIADLDEDDADYVATYAEKFGLSLPEARKNKDVQAVLSVRAEERRTASATNTGTVRRGTSRVSDDTLLSQASSGNLPDDAESLQRIARARLKKRAQ